MFGQNKYGQLGSGDFKPKPGICEVKGPLVLKQVEKVACGDGFTVVATKGIFEKVVNCVFTSFHQDFNKETSLKWCMLK